MHPWLLLALPDLPQEVLQSLMGDLPIVIRVPDERSQAGVARAIPDADLVLGDWAAQLRLTSDEIVAAKRLVFVQQPSVGVDSVDVHALRDAGVPVANTSGVNAVAVAEWCLAAGMASLRRISWADAQLHTGGWPQAQMAQEASLQGGSELAGRRVGVVGMGAIGRECAKRFVALGADVAHWSRRHRSAHEAGGSAWLPLDELLERSQLLVVAIALSDETRGLLSAARLGLLPPGAHVVNVGRGELLDETALLAALDSGQLGGAALDVFASEPLATDSPLRTHERVILSPHVAGATAEAQQRLLRAVVENLARITRGEPVMDVVNGLDGSVVRR